MNQNKARKKIRKKETNDLKVCTGWTQEWTSPKRVRRNKCLEIHEIVRGPFSSPKLLKTQPIVAVSPYGRAIRIRRNCNNLRYGIPDAWKEYLASKGLCNSVEACVLQKNLIPSCVRSFATDRLWNDLGLPLVQGIPDPWKCRSLPRRRPVKYSKRRCSYNKNSSMRITCIYDGDDEAEIEHSVKSQSNKDHVDDKKDPFQEGNKKSNPPLVMQEILRTHEENSKGIKRNVRKRVDRLPACKNVKLTSRQKKQMQQFKDDFNREKKETERMVNTRKISSRKNKKKHTSNMHIIERKKAADDVKQFLQKYQNNLNTETIKNDISPVLTEKTEHGSVQVDVKDNVERVQNSFNENHLNINAQKCPNTVCCNCMLQNHISSSIKSFCNYMDTLRGVNILNRVLCQNCESIYYNRNPQKLNLATKTVDFCVPNTKGILKRKIVMQGKLYEWTKHKVCTCFQKAKERFEESNRIETKSNIVSNQELKLVCGRCDSSYLKIASICADTVDRTSCSSTCKKRSKGLENKRYKIMNHVSKYPMIRKQRRNIVRCSKNYCCTCVENKMHASKRDLEQTSYSTAVQGGNNMAKKNIREISKNDDHNAFKKELLDVKFHEKVKKNTRNAIQTSFHDDAGRKEIIEIYQTKRIPKHAQRSRSFIDSNTTEALYKKQVSKDNCCDVRRRNKTNNSKSNDSTITIDEETEVKQFQLSSSDPTLKYSVSDSGEYADVSDNFVNLSTNVAAQDRSSVTSITFIERLNSTILIRKLYRKENLKETRSFRDESSAENLKNFEKILKIEDKMTNDNRKNFRCNSFSCSTFEENGNEEG